MTNQDEHAADQSKSTSEPPILDTMRSAARTNLRGGRDLLFVGTIASVILVFLCMVGAGILCWRVVDYSDVKEPNALLLRLLLSCIVCFIGMAFGCLGFGLFLIQAKGAFEGEGADSKGGTIKLKSSAPGLVVIVCATAALWMALHISWDETRESHQPVVSAPSKTTPTPQAQELPEVKIP